LVRRLLGTAVFGYFALFAVLILLLGYRWNVHRKPPTQPIAYSHEIHVGKLGLKCESCHTSVDTSTFAGVPSVSRCMECHKTVLADRPEIKKLHKYWTDKKPIPWNRVYRIRIRNYVYFSHKRHIKAGIKCLQCHGEVKAMPQMRAVRSLKMGWCKSCHLAHNAPTDCLTCHR